MDWEMELHTAIIFTIITYHKHDLPFEYVIAYEPATYPRDAFVALHLL